MAPPEFEVTSVSLGVNEDRKFSRQTLRLRNRYFQPRLIGARLELSTFCIDLLSDDETWGLLDQHCDRPAVVARVDISVNFIRENGLEIEPDWDPERHVNVLRWPLDEDARKSLCQVISAQLPVLVRAE